MTPSEWLERHQTELVEDCPIARITRSACKARSRAFLFSRKPESVLNPRGCIGCRHGIPKEVYEKITAEVWNAHI